MKTEREKDLEAADWLSECARFAWADGVLSVDDSVKETKRFESSCYERAAVALRKLVEYADEVEQLRAQLAEYEDDHRAITAMEVTLFGVKCHLPACIAGSVVRACELSALIGRFDLGDGEYIEAHVLFGVNVYNTDGWCQFETVTLDEHRATMAKIKENTDGL